MTQLRAPFPDVGEAPCTSGLTRDQSGRARALQLAVQLLSDNDEVSINGNAAGLIPVARLFADFILIGTAVPANEASGNE